MVWSLFRGKGEKKVSDIFHEEAAERNADIVGYYERLVKDPTRVAKMIFFPAHPGEDCIQFYDRVAVQAQMVEDLKKLPERLQVALLSMTVSMPFHPNLKQLERPGYDNGLHGHNIGTQLKFRCSEELQQVTDGLVEKGLLVFVDGATGWGRGYKVPGNKKPLSPSANVPK